MSPAARPKLSTDAFPDFEPAWEILTLFPSQGRWTESEYHDITKRTNRLVELVHGRIEFPPMPTVTHQMIALFFCNLLNALKGGLAVPAAFKLRLGPEHYREPDVVFLLDENMAEHFADDEWKKADLVLEVVSPNDPKRDYVDKRAEYAAAGISEYWIADSKNSTVLVLELVNGLYIDHGPYTAGQTAVSKLLPQFSVNVDVLFEAGRVKPKA